MNLQKRNASQRLLSFISWKLALFIALGLTILSVALRAPLKTFPTLATQANVVNDPYDLRADRIVTDARTHVETGL